MTVALIVWFWLLSLRNMTRANGNALSVDVTILSITKDVLIVGLLCYQIRNDEPRLLEHR